MLVAASLVAWLAGRPALGDGSGLTRSVRTSSGAEVVEERRLSDRRTDLTIRSPALGDTVHARLLLPPGWSKDARRTWPTLWLLHGALGDYRTWSEKTDVERLTESSDVIVVMPDGGPCGSYSDWWNRGDGGPPKWETFHMIELMEILNRYHAGDRRAIAGYSMGGQGAMLYPARHPGVFRSSASFSGAVHILAPGFPQAVMLGTTLGCLGTDWKRIWGDPDVQREIWRAHNPYDLAEKLRGVKLYVASGDGRKRPGELFGDAAEEITYRLSKAFAGRLGELGIPVETHFYPGKHTFPYWQAELHRAYPMLMASIA